MRLPSDEKAAIGALHCASRRRTRSVSGKSSPARSVAATRMARVWSGSVMHEQAQVSTPSAPAPSPRSCSNRVAPSGRKVAASRAT